MIGTLKIWFVIFLSPELFDIFNFEFSLIKKIATTQEQ